MYGYIQPRVYNNVYYNVITVGIPLATEEGGESQDSCTVAASSSARGCATVNIHDYIMHICSTTTHGIT